MQRILTGPESIAQSGDVTVGTVWSETLARPASPPMMINRTHFTPGSRTCWHVHPLGQVLIIESGLALVQEEGGPIVGVWPGQTVVCDPGVRHWHGAAPQHTMTQFAVTPADEHGGYAVWGAQVSEDEYNQWTKAAPVSS